MDWSGHLLAKLSASGVAGGFLLGFPALFSIVNPLGSSLVFSQVLAGRPHAERTLVAGRIGLYAAVVLLVSLWAGEHILRFFGVSIAALRIAGGTVVAVRAWSMLNAPEVTENRKNEQARAPASALDQAFYPLTMPFTTGPGSMAVAVALSAAGPQPDGVAGHAGFLPFMTGVSAAALAIALIVWITYRFADAVLRLIGPSGARVVSRLVAFLLLCIGTQIALTGVQDVLRPLG